MVFVFTVESLKFYNRCVKNASVCSVLTLRLIWHWHRVFAVMITVPMYLMYEICIVTGSNYKHTY